MLLEAFPAEDALMGLSSQGAFPGLLTGWLVVLPKCLTWVAFVLQDGQFPQEPLLSFGWDLSPGLSGLRG